MAGSKALITGASSGIGRALTKLLVKEGYTVIIHGRDVEALSTLKGELESKNVHVFSCDLRNPKPFAELLQKEKPTLVVNNAGFGLYGDAIGLETEKQLDMVSVNCSAILYLTLEAVKLWKRFNLGGTVLNVSSVASEQATPGMAVYGASKAFVTRLSEAMDFELKPYGIRVLASCPGMVETNFSKRAGGKPSSKRQGPVMSADFAAKEILWQIKKGKSKHLFNGFYKWGAVFSRVLVPKKVVFNMIYSRLRSRIHS